jgi:hypothetical protein
LGLSGIAFAVAFASLLGAAQADAVSSMAATCTPCDPAIQNNLYTIQAGSVRHQDGKIGVITLYCPLSVALNIPHVGSYGWMGLVFIDPDGPGNEYYIEAQIIRSDFQGGVAAVSGVLSSNGLSLCVRERKML